jgi:hypothetical protein
VTKTTQAALRRRAITRRAGADNVTYETVPLQQLLREIAGRTASEEDADAIRLAADTLDEQQPVGRFLLATPQDEASTAMLQEIEKAIDILDPEMSRQEIVKLRERLVRFRSSI